jgi:hypothetical protein
MHPMRKPKRLGPIQWPSFQGQATLAGVSPSGTVSVYYDLADGPSALKNAQQLLSVADKISEANAKIFGITAQPVNVILFPLGGATDGSGGADHMGCDFVSGGNLEVDLSLGSLPRVAALFEAELSECAMQGQLCGLSTGEALSRWCAMAVSGNALSDFASAPVWQQDGEANWVDQTQLTDQDYDSIGCGMAMLSLMLQTWDLDEVAQAMVALGDNGTLADLGAQLSGATSPSAWSKLLAAVAGLPGGQVTSDDPFGAMGRLSQWLCV